MNWIHSSKSRPLTNPYFKLQADALDSAHHSPAVSSFVTSTSNFPINDWAIIHETTMERSTGSILRPQVM